jgi:hypothetical protein
MPNPGKMKKSGITSGNYIVIGHLKIANGDR